VLFVRWRDTCWHVSRRECVAGSREYAGEAGDAREAGDTSEASDAGARSDTSP
jgi:hypothetical protein